MKKNKVYEIIIIGAGSAGIAARNEISKKTKNYLVIDSGPIGTTCARVGCMPSKAFIEAAKIFHQRKKFKHIGVSGTEGVKINSKLFLKHVRKLRDSFVQSVHKDVEKWITSHLLVGKATFVDQSSIMVDGKLLFAKKFIIATGSKPIIPSTWSAVAGDVLTSDNFFEQKYLPNKIAVVGSGAIGLELAQALAHSGTKVILFGAENSMGGLTDPIVMDYARLHLSKELQIKTELVKDIVKTKIGFRVQTSKFSVNVEQVLVATGRKPNLENLNLKKIGINLDNKGLPSFDSRTMRIVGTNLYLAGDVSAFRPVLHEASDDGRIAARNDLANKDTAFARRTKLLITFTNPQIAIVGKSFREIKSEKKSYVAAEVTFDNQGRARTMLENVGIIRIYAEKNNGLLLGAEIFAPGGEHLAHYVAAAIGMSSTVFDLLSQPIYHPVLEEGLRTALRRLSKKVAHQCKDFDLSRCRDAIVGS